MLGMCRFLRFLLAVCIAAAPSLATAQSIYKVQMPDGTILFTDTPPAEAKVLEERSAKVTPRPVTPTAARPPGVANAPAGGAAPAPRVESSINVASAAVSTAERELAVATRALELGREPLPGERLGLKGGGTRLSPEYDARLRALEQAVSDSEAKLRRALDTKNAAR
ncbi:MAG: hypothetical protein ACREBN_04370 [Burkholderiaceae bacterium]